MPDWEAIVVREPVPDVFEGWSDERIGFDPRIRHFEFPQRMDDWGNTVKEWASLRHATGDFICQTNDDNYYVPTFFAEMLKLADAGADFVYCNMLHNGLGYKMIDAQPRPGKIDGGGWIAKRELVNSVPWPEEKRKGCPDGVYAMALSKKATKVAKHEGVLFVHN